MPESDKLRFEPQDNLTGVDFSFRKNKEMSKDQANETFVVDARFNRSLGQNGETMGFAKKQFSTDPDLQAVRQAACNQLDSLYSELSKKPAVIQWKAERRELEGLPSTLPAARRARDEAARELEGLRAAEAPDPVALQQAEQQMERCSQKLDKLQTLHDNQDREKWRLLSVLNRTPEMRQYLATAEAQRAAASLAGSVSSISEASSYLYEARKAMDNDPNLGGDRQLLARAVASHEVDKMIGLNVCAEEKFGLDADGSLLGISIQCDGTGVRSQFGQNDYGESQIAFLDIDYSNANVQQGLHDLEALDYITGQLDRHPGNIFVDPESGKVTGIDNDMAFPEVDRQKIMDNAPPLIKAKAVGGMPQMMHAETAEKFAKVNPAEFRKKLESIRPPNGNRGLGAKEIEGAVKRLGELQTAIADAKQGLGKLELVQQFDKDTYTRAVNAQVQKGREASSYVGTVHNERLEAELIMSTGATSHRMREAVTAGKARINPEYAAFMRMPAEEAADYRAMQAAVDKLEVKLEEVRKDMARLEHPGLKDRLAALTHGGVEHTRQHLIAKESAIVKDLNLRMTGLRQMTNPYVEAAKQAAQKRVALVENAVEAPQNMVPQNVAPKAVRQDEPAKVAGLSKVPKTNIPSKNAVAAADMEATKKPSVGEVLHVKSNAAEAGPEVAPKVAGAESKPGGKTLRDSVQWQKTKPTPKPGGNSLTSSHH